MLNAGVVRRFAVVVIVLAGTTGCADVDDGTLPTSGPVAQWDRLRDHVGEGFGLVGTLKESDGCLVVERPGSKPVTPVFPSGNTDWEDDALHWAGDTYQAGDKIKLSGGSDKDVVYKKMFIPKACEGTKLFYLDWWEGDEQYVPNSDANPFPAAK